MSIPPKRRPARRTGIRLEPPIVAAAGRKGGRAWAEFLFPASDGGGYTVRATVRRRADSAPEVSELTIKVAGESDGLTSREGDGRITSDLLRAVPVASVLAAVLASEGGEDRFEPFTKPARRGAQPVAREELEAVAAIYRASVGQRSVLKAIMDARHVARPTAAKYVRLAKNVGLIPDVPMPTGVGRSQIAPRPAVLRLAAPAPTTDATENEDTEVTP